MKSKNAEPSKSAYRFEKPAIYKIEVAGSLGEEWSNRLNGMQISHVPPSEDKRPVSLLIGQVNDQSALSGVLNTLYDFRIPIISVNMLEEKKEQK